MALKPFSYYFLSLWSIQTKFASRLEGSAAKRRCSPRARSWQTKTLIINSTSKGSNLQSRWTYKKLYSHSRPRSWIWAWARPKNKIYHTINSKAEDILCLKKSIFALGMCWQWFNRPVLLTRELDENRLPGIWVSLASGLEPGNLLHLIQKFGVDVENDEIN